MSSKSGGLSDQQGSRDTMESTEDQQMQHVQVHIVFMKITDSLYHQIN